MYLVFDTETSGLPSFKEPIDSNLQPRIVQLGFIVLDEKFREQMSFSSLIRPSEWAIEEQASKVHGITLEDCEKYGVDIKFALDMFHLATIRVDRVFAYGLKFDSFLIDIEMTKIHQSLFDWYTYGRCLMWEMTPICKLTQSNSKRRKWPSLDEAYDYCFNEPRVNQHQALYYCRDTCKILKWLVDNNHINYNLPSEVSQS